MARDRATYRELVAKTKRSAMETSIMRSIEEQSRYPAHNQRFPLGRYDPVLRAREVERRTAKDESGNRKLTVYTDQKNYDLGASVRVTAELDSAKDHPDFPETLQATLSTEQHTVLATLSLHAVAQGRYEALIDALSAADGRALAAGLYVVQVSLAEGPSQTCAFTLRASYARFTGHYRDAIVEGGLVVEAEIEVHGDGEYHALASLYADDGLPVGVTEQTYLLSRGVHWVKLHYHGRLMRDAARPGPFRLAHVQLSMLTFPVARGVETDPDYWTAAYSARDFDETPYNVLEPLDDEP